MAILISPGVSISEIDLTTIIPSVATTVGAFSGFFSWGPINTRIVIGDTTTLVNTIQKPNGNNYPFFYSAYNFLTYGNNLEIVRAAPTNCYNATANVNATILIPNEKIYSEEYFQGNGGQFGPWLARYAGALGNSITVARCGSAQAYASNVTSLTGITVTATQGSANVLATNNVATQIAVGDLLLVGNVAYQGSQGYITVTSISANGNVITLASNPVSSSNSGLSLNRKWQFANKFNGPPGTSAYVAQQGGANDQMHIVVLDANGVFNRSSSNNYILETYPFVSKAVDAKNNDGTSNYYAQVLFNNSKYVYWADHPTEAVNWGQYALNTSFYNSMKPSLHYLGGGNDGQPYGFLNFTNGISDPNDSALLTGYGYFQNGDEVDVSLVISGPSSPTVQAWLIQNVSQLRLDCVTFVSPRYIDVVNQQGYEATNITGSYLNALGVSSSYAVCDSGWKYQFDQYGKTYRYVPLNADIAGLCARTDITNGPWWSPAGYNRGLLNNVTRLAWNPSNLSGTAYRDLLYQNGVNPVMTVKGIGTVLYGDKTLLSTPSAFDRINVRRLFITIEKAIATASKYSLFQFNDVFTRASFINMVTPYLQNIKGQRGIYDFTVVCDTTNNTPAVIDADQFVGDIYIKPARSINFIQLNFVAVGTGVAFSEVVGSFD